MRELAQIRQELDEIDREMVKLFERRMTLCREVARTKLAQGKPVLDASREAQVLESRAARLTDASLVEAVQALYREMIYENVWGGEYNSTGRTVDLHVQRLKKKLGLEDHIQAVYKIGYRLVV